MQCPHDIELGDHPQIGLCPRISCTCAERISRWLLSSMSSEQTKPDELRWWELHGDL